MSVPPERRGRTHIPENVVSKIATRAAQEVGGVVEVRRRGPVPRGRAADATVHGGLASLRLDVSVAYPVPIRSVADQLRRHVATRVHQMTGLAIGHVDIDVAALVPGARPAPGPEPAAGTVDETADTRPEVPA
ncbi:Asp23/Gls24 family envelope stress response protein [Streptosporangium soli]|nr:Asp23/Gls24 family envelope stress response protein [Streptosporangium sp. KLBMP 9127]